MKIQKNILLAPHTTFKIGGAARFFCEAKNEDDILKALKFAQEKKLPVFVLGGGSNVLVSDKGFEGLVVKMNVAAWRFDLQKGGRTSIIMCDAGCLLSKIVRESVKAGLTGLEWAAGIPGTIGGAVRGNAGAFGGMMGEIIEEVGVLEINKKSFSPQMRGDVHISFSKKNLGGQRGVENISDNHNTTPLIPSSTKEGRIIVMNKQDCKFSYRNSIFKQNPNLIILSVKLKLKKGNRNESEDRIKEILAKRKEKQPADFPSAGSFFKNPLLRQGFGGQAVVKNNDLRKQFEMDTGLKLKDDKIPAGYLIDQLDLRGKKIGGAMVSEKHANFIVNTGNATAEDVVMLAAIIKTKVRNKFGIQLQEEVQMVGF